MGADAHFKLVLFRTTWLENETGDETFLNALDEILLFVQKKCYPERRQTFWQKNLQSAVYLITKAS